LSVYMLAIVNISHQYESRGKSIKFTKKTFFVSSKKHNSIPYS